MWMCAAANAAWTLSVFPINGLDRSLHAPVLVGLLFLWFFAETLGWTYAGLVVPGYLAAVFAASPLTGALVLAEAVVTYLFGALTGRWLPKTGAWSSTFGRERFFLLIVGAVLVRLAVEGNLIPWLTARYGMSHSRELYSLGLVLVPLLANMFWNTGLRAAAPRVLLVTALTFLVVQYVLLAHTNFTISRFEVANESVSLTFLESPHAHIILVLGALLAARNNVLYGWDYSGILVPALLAVAWYSPAKLATTVLEALAVYGLARLLTARGPLSRVLIVGPRRVMLAFAIGFALKVVVGFILERVDRSVQLVDWFGFGYLLPSLLAVKMWNKEKIGIVLMPTLQVSIVAFLLGNATGWALNWLSGTAQAKSAPLSSGEPPSPAYALLQGTLAPAPKRANVEQVSLAALRVARQAERGQLDRATVNRARKLGLSVYLPTAAQPRWTTVIPQASDPNADRVMPRFSVQPDDGSTLPWLVVAEARGPADPIVVAAHHLALRLGARAYVLVGPLATQRRFDEAFAQQLKLALGLQQVLVVRTHPHRTRLSVVGEVPPRLDAEHLAQWLGARAEVIWRAAEPKGAFESNQPRLELRLQDAERVAAAVLGTPPPERWQGDLRDLLAARIEELTETSPAASSRASVGELRLYSSVVLPALLDAAARGEPSAFQRAIAGQLALRFVELRDGGPSPSWALLEPSSAARRGLPTLWLRPLAERTRRAGSARAPIGIELEAPRWAAGTLAAGLGLADGLRADAFLLAGALPSADGQAAVPREGSLPRAAFMQRAHELWVDGGGLAISVRGVAPDRALSSDVVLSYGREVSTPSQGPEWALPLVHMLKDNSLAVATFDGTAERAVFEGASDWALSYVRRFGRDQMALAWLTAELRQRFLAIQVDDETGRRLQALGAKPRLANVAEEAITLAACTAEDEGRSLATLQSNRVHRCPAPPSPGQCDLLTAEQPWLAYTEQRNPYLLARALEFRPRGCHQQLLLDPETRLLWVLSAGSGRARLLPLRGPPPAAPSRTFFRLDALERAVALGLSRLEVGAAP